MSTERAYRLSIGSNGHKGQEFETWCELSEVEDLTSFSRFAKKELILVLQKCVFVANDILTMLRIYPTGKQEVRIGRSKFAQVTEDDILQALYSNEYERRNDRERAVQVRNDEALTILAELVG